MSQFLAFNIIDALYALNVLFFTALLDCDPSYAENCDQGCAKLSGTDTCTCSDGYTLHTDGFICIGNV